MLSRSIGIVKSIDRVREGACEITVAVDGNLRRAIAYSDLVSSINIGDEVLLNTTAVSKRLGTGGVDFVISNCTNPVGDTKDSDIGHIVKARYTPVQHTVLSVEEEDSPHRAVIDNFQSLNGLPVVIGQLHSQLGPACAAIKRLMHDQVRIAYIMTDTAALPISFSRLVSDLRTKGLIDASITTGQAFGGDYDAVNLYTALIAAKEVVQADAVICCPGPGHVGTGTQYGFTAIEQGEIVNRVNLLGGSPIAIARISYADPRPRHQGLSHHTLTALGFAAITQCTLVLPMIDQMKLAMLQEQIAHSAVVYKHRIRILDGRPGIVELQEKNVQMSSMGRNYEQDPEFFLSAAAAGALAAEIIAGH